MRIPLYAKLMLSYLLVVGLVFLPTWVYVRTIQRGEARENVRKDLLDELTILQARLGTVAPEKLDSAIRSLLEVMPSRLTVVDPTGTVLGDSTGRTLENHANRPEILAALQSENGIGFAERRSATQGERLLYVARRYPATGPVRGVVRLSVPTARIDQGEQQSTVFVNRAGALALSAALVLSLVAALVVSRPLQRIADGARAFAAGDFGHPIDVRTGDELEDAADALSGLAAQLRDRLVQAGADRAALHGLIDDLPVGVILYDPTGQPVVLNGTARCACELTPSHELERARALRELPSQSAVLQRVLEEGVTGETTLDLPWASPPKTLHVRWIATYAADGTRQPALVIVDEDRPSAALSAVVRTSVRRLREAALELGSHPLAADLRKCADEAEQRVPAEVPTAVAVEVVALDALCAAALSQLESGRNDVRLSLEDPTVRVVDAGGRTRRAIRDFLAAALGGAGGPLTVTGTQGVAGIRLVVSTPHEPHGVRNVADLVRGLGGDAGTSRAGDRSESWLVVPRA